MMLKTLCVFAMVLLVTQVFGRDSSNGCGVGWDVTEKKSLSATTTRGTTNMTLPNTFSMTSGTSGCEDHSLVKVEKMPLHFSEANYEMLLSDMSNGRGETVATLAAILGCEKTAFASSLQNNFANLAQAQNGIELYDMISAGSYCQVQ